VIELREFDEIRSDCCLAFSVTSEPYVSSRC